MSQADYINLLKDVPYAVAILMFGALFVWRLPAIGDSITRVIEKVNDGKKQDAIAQDKVIEAGTEVVKIAVAALKEAVATQVDGFMQQVAALKTEYKAEIEALKENFAMENTKKDDQIRKLEEEVERLKLEKSELQVKVNELEDKLRAKANKKKLMQADGDGNRARAVSGDK